jgi:uncharacterized protein
MIQAPITEWTLLASLAGGALIGCAAVLLMALHGRIAGMTGILAGLLPPALASDWQWRAAFLAGAIASPLVYWGLFGQPIEITVPVSTSMLFAGGIIVGLGVTFGSGCTSGHGVCGLARFSTRSLAAVVVFMLSTGVTVYITRHILAG